MHFKGLFKKLYNHEHEKEGKGSSSAEPTELELQMEKKLDSITKELDVMKITVNDISERVCHNSEDLHALIEAEQIIHAILEEAEHNSEDNKSSN